MQKDVMIYRQAAIDAFYTATADGDKAEWCECVLRNVPSVQTTYTDEQNHRKENRMDKYGYIGIETLLNFCENSKDHAVAPNDFMRMKRLKEPERKTGKWLPTICNSDGMHHEWCGFHCSICKEATVIRHNYCPRCGAKMERGEE